MNSDEHCWIAGPRGPDPLRWMAVQSPVAQSPEERGLEIAEEVDRRDTGFKDFSSRRW